MLNCNEMTEQGEVQLREWQVLISSARSYLIPLGREALDRPDLHVKHPLDLSGHPLLFKGVWDEAKRSSLFPDQNESSEADEKQGSTPTAFHSLLPAPVHFSKALLSVIQYNSTFSSINTLLQRLFSFKAFWLAEGFLTWATSGKGQSHGPT